MGVSILSRKTLRSLSEPHPSIPTLLSHLSLPRSETRAERKDGGSRSSPSSSSSSLCSESSLFSLRNRYSPTVLNPFTHSGFLRCYSASASAAAAAVVTSSPDVPKHRRSLSDAFKQKKDAKKFWEIVELVRNDDGDLRSKLDSIKLKFNVNSVREILRVLNREKVSALSFFNWLKQRHHDLTRNSSLWNLMIDNCGGCDDYETMRSLLIRCFNSKGVAVKKDAFQFLALNSIDECALAEEAIRNVVRVLKEVKGVAYPTGIQSLVELLADSGSFDMAKLVIKESDMRVSYYSTLIKAMCKKHEYEQARAMMGEMREACGKDCVDYDRHVYNYMISTMLKAGQEGAAGEVLQEMVGKGCAPDALTYEIFICDCVAKGRVSSGMEFFDRMVEAGLEPRRSTHAAVIKVLFGVERYDEAYEYVVLVSNRVESSGGQVYNLLAELHRRKGNVVTSKNILCAMMSKGLVPQQDVYAMVLRSLQESGRKGDAMDLEEQYRRLQLVA